MNSSNTISHGTIKAKNKDINDLKLIEYALGTLSLILVPILYYFTHITSLTFAIGTCLLFAFCMVSTHYIHKPVDKLNFMEDDLATVAHVMAEFKKQYNRNLIINSALGILWVIWFCLEIWKQEHTIPYVALFGGVVGGIAGFRKEREAMNIAQEIIDEIEKN